MSIRLDNIRTTVERVFEYLPDDARRDMLSLLSGVILEFHGFDALEGLHAALNSRSRTHAANTARRTAHTVVQHLARLQMISNRDLQIRALWNIPGWEPDLGTIRVAAEIDRLLLASWDRIPTRDRVLILGWTEPGRMLRRLEDLGLGDPMSYLERGRIALEARPAAMRVARENFAVLGSSVVRRIADYVLSIRGPPINVLGASLEPPSLVAWARAYEPPP